MAKKLTENVRSKLQKTPTWTKLSIIFVIGLIASSPAENLVNEVYVMFNALFSGNITYVAEQLGISGGKLLYNFVLVAILIGLFVYLAKQWNKDGDVEDKDIRGDIKDIKAGVNILLSKEGKREGGRKKRHSSM